MPLRKMSPGPDEAGKGKRSKWHINPFHPKDSNPPSHESLHPPDSTYGSIEPTNSVSSGTWNSSLTNSDTSRPFSQETSMGSEANRSSTNPPISQETHHDPRTGTTITTVTTTTTTTTTTTGPGGTYTVEVPRNENTSNDNRPVAHPVSSVPDLHRARSQEDCYPEGPPIPARSIKREGDRSSFLAPAPRLPELAENQTTIPTTPATSSQHNFSYPARTPPVPGTEPGPRSTLANLKTAAAGIHGASETLRGTLNYSLDRRFGAPPATLAQDEEAIRRGRAEIESGQFYHLNHDKERGSRVSSMVDKAYQLREQAGHLGIGTGSRRTEKSPGGRLRVVNE